ncbi:esterase [Azohydromonas lata]|uniref:Esterase n=1 Tax=Azohydromonas lata TaxID=45677 RepID=A0ABU5IF35_9BURK|nr:esterase [Azohydromonas lata]MDZ5457737.1 esterase [Azohydromonas lata]
MSDCIEFIPNNSQGLPPPQLMVLLHGVGADAASMIPTARALQREFPQAALLIPEGFDDFDGGPQGRQWFSVSGVTEENRPQRVAAARERFVAWLRAAQQRLRATPAVTALVGFSQGAILALETAQAEDGLAGRVLAFGGRYAVLPDHAPRETTLHLLHGAQDTVMPTRHAREALERLALLGGDATLDIAEGVGHELHPALLDEAIHRLRTHIPHRTWQAALGAVSSAQRGGDCEH